MTQTRVESSRLIPASAEQIFGVLRDPAGHVAIDSTGMLQSAAGDPVSKVGDEFVVHMDRRSLNDRPLGLYDVTVVITQYQEPALIEWTVKAFGRPANGHLYGYELAPAEEGTETTSYYDWTSLAHIPERAASYPVVPPFALAASLGILQRHILGSDRSQ